MKKIKVVDLFCGVGGLTNGLKQAGLDVVAGFDFDKSCRYAYEINNDVKFFHKDIHDLTASEINEHFLGAEIKILVGCAPCQPFSSHSNNRNKTLNLDSRWNLLNEFLRLIEQTSPDIISMENVPQLVKHEIFHNFVAELYKFGYKLSYTIVYCPDYGLPQNRKRLVLLASKYGSIKIIPVTHLKDNYKSVKNSIGHLRILGHGESDEQDLLHKSSSLSELNLKRIKASKPSGTWRDWPIELLPDCYTKDTGQSYSAVYGRMSWDKPSPTITTQFNTFGTGRYGHPEQNRALSLREGAILQGFSESYSFIQPSMKISSRIIARHIGNAVPPILGKVIGKSIINHIEGNTI